MSFSRATAEAILEMMKKQSDEVYDDTSHPMFKIGYGAAMSDLRHCVGDIIPDLKA